MNNERYGLPLFSGMMVANCKKNEGYPGGVAFTILLIAINYLQASAKSAKSDSKLAAISRRNAA